MYLYKNRSKGRGQGHVNYFFYISDPLRNFWTGEVRHFLFSLTDRPQRVLHTIIIIIIIIIIHQRIQGRQSGHVLHPICQFLPQNWFAQVIHVSGHVALPTTDDTCTPLQPLFYAVCTSATATSDVKDGLASYNTTGFQSIHTLDMKYREISHK